MIQISDENLWKIIEEIDKDKWSAEKAKAIALAKGENGLSEAAKYLRGLFGYGGMTSKKAAWYLLDRDTNGKGIGDKFIAVKDFDDGEIEVTSVTVFDDTKEEMKRKVSEGIDRMIEEIGLEPDERAIPLRISRQVEVDEESLFDLIDSAVPITKEELGTLEKFGLGPSKQWDITKQILEWE